MDELAVAVSAHRAGDLEAAERGYRAILAREPCADAANNLGLLLSARGDLEEALALLSRAAASGKRGSHYRNLGNLYQRLGRLHDARGAYVSALALTPDDVEAKHSLGVVRLALGEPEGWELFDYRKARLSQIARDRLPFPEWRGEPLAGKRLLVIGEQGLGDQILGSGFLSSLEAEAVTFSCAAALMPLFAQLPRVTCAARGGPIPIRGLDYWAMNLSLPRWSQWTGRPYLTATPRATGKIGVAWRGNQTPDPGRSLPEDIAAELLSRPGAISLQPEDTGARDFRETAEIIAGLDHVLSIDTSIAHLAGAMGKPGTVMLQHRARDWRWREGEPGWSYWYPSLRIARQPTHGDWRGLVAVL